MQSVLYHASKMHEAINLKIEAQSFGTLILWTVSLWVSVLG